MHLIIYNFFSPTEMILFFVYMLFIRTRDRVCQNAHILPFRHVLVQVLIILVHA